MRDELTLIDIIIAGVECTGHVDWQDEHRCHRVQMINLIICPR
jgi:hypothetical protein